MQLNGGDLLMDNKLENLLDKDSINWWVDRMYLQDAWGVAVNRSTDSNTQVGAALVIPGGGMIHTEYNDVCERLKSVDADRLLNYKNYYTETAVRRLIFKMIKSELSTEGLTVYTTWGCSADCARVLIEFGISRFVTIRELVARTPSRWSETVEEGIRMLRSASVEVVGWNGDLGVMPSILFDGRYVSPGDIAGD